jgi:uncharacterized RDD family membrane protein YckC
VELEDRIMIATPEGVELQLVLAGVGSRFIAASVDLFIQATLIVLAAVVGLLLIGGFAGKALFFVAAFADYLYDIPFEVLASGRTPGKRLTHLRVVREGGAPVNLTASFIRNVLRFVDWLPSAYLVGLASILASTNNQRVGDHAAGTLVIREVVEATGAKATTEQPVDSSGWDVSAVSDLELTVARRFLQRRSTLDPDARAALANGLEQGLRPKVAGVPPDLEPERFLTALVQAKARR